MAKKSSIQMLAEFAADTERSEGDAKKGGKPTRDILGRTEQKSFFTTKSMCRQLVLAKADHGMTYDAIINEALEFWLTSKGAPS